MTRRTGCKHVWTPAKPHDVPVLSACLQGGGSRNVQLVWSATPAGGRDRTQPDRIVERRYQRHVRRTLHLGSRTPVSDPAQAWIAAEHPELEPLPSPDAGRSHRQEQLSQDEGYFQSGADRPGVHRPPAAHRAEALAGHVTLEHPCSHCGTEETTHSTVRFKGQILRDLGNRCYRRLRKKGRLPDLG